MVPWRQVRPSCRRTSAWTPVTAERAPTELRSRKNAGAAPRTTLVTVVVSIVGVGAALAVGWSLLTSIAGRSSLPPEPEVGSAPSAGASAALGGLVHASVVSATDAAAADSVWFLLDGRGRRVHRFDKTGALLESFAGPGEGPGELSSPTAIAVHRGAVAVADRGVVRLYDFAGGSVADRRLAFDGCLAPRTIGIESVSRGLLLLVQCASPLRGVVARVFLASDDGDVRLVASRSPAGRGFVADLGFVPVMSAHPEGFVFGDANAECLDVFSVLRSPLLPKRPGAFATTGFDACPFLDGARRLSRIGCGTPPGPWALACSCRGGFRLSIACSRWPTAGSSTASQLRRQTKRRWVPACFDLHSGAKGRRSWLRRFPRRRQSSCPTTPFWRSGRP